jgi:two-component system cell cycle sensor histidine kinase/response regulator CckA
MEQRNDEQLGASFRTLFEAALDAVIISDREGVVLDANGAALALFGVPREELLGSTTARFLVDDDLAILREQFRSTGQLRIELEVRRPDGTVRVVESVARADFVPGRNLAILRDVTERRATEKALLRSEERFSKAFSASPVPIAIVRARDERYVEANDAFLKLTARPREAIVGHTSPEAGLAPPGTRARIVDQVAREGQNFEGEVDVLRPSGEARQALISIQPIEIDGEACRLVVFRDVTEAREAQAARRAEAAKFRALIEHSTDIFMLVDREAKILYASPAFTRILGYSVEDWMGRSAIELVLPETAADERARLGEAVEGVGGVRRAIRTARHADGTLLKFETTSVTRLDDPDIGAIVINLRDVTERERAKEKLDKMEEQLRHSQKMEAIGSLAGGVAHDFNNLLSIILGYTAIVLEELGDAEHVRADVEEIEGAARRAADLNPRVEGLHKMLRRLVGEGIELVTQLAPGLGSVLLDPGRFDQVLLNIVANARDAMPMGGRILIETANVDLDPAYAAMHAGVEAGPFVMVVVTDTGAGMDAATRDRIFEPFFTTKELGKGTGLGLATVFGIVKQHGGHIWVYSEPGHGTSFKLYFPRHDGPDETVARAGRTRPAAPTGSETVLLVEDDDGVRALVRTVLKRAGYTVIEASSPAEAIGTCERLEGTIHLLLTDVIMPKMSGKALAERLVGMKPGMRVLYMSGYTDDAIVQHGVLEAGVAFIQKPFAPHVLAAKVRQVLDATEPPS